MKIMIAKPKPHPATIRMQRLVCCEPLELEYLHAALEEYDTRIVDGSRWGCDPLKHARRFRPDIVLYTSYIVHCTRVLEEARGIKQFLPGVRVFAGGVHAEVCPEHFDSPYIDGVFFADQLSAVRAVAQRIAAGEAFDDVPGLALRKGAAFVRNLPAPAATPSLPPPRRILFTAAPRRYRYLHFSRCASVRTAWGCTGRCTFCFCREMNGGAYAARPLGEVVDEIASIPADAILLLDDNFLVDPRRLERFAEMITERGIRKQFIAYGSASFVANHPSLMATLKAAGLEALIIGLEFIDDTSLKEVQKSATSRDNDLTVSILRHYGIELIALFIISPRWHHKNFRTLARYIGTRAIRFATFSTITVFPGTEEYRRRPAHERGEGNWWRYDLLRVHEKPAHMSAVLYYLWLYYLYLLPGLRSESVRWMLRRCGVWKTVWIIGMGALTGAEYLLKVLIWR